MMSEKPQMAPVGRAMALNMAEPEVSSKPPSLPCSHSTSQKLLRATPARTVHGTTNTPVYALSAMLKRKAWRRYSSLRGLGRCWGGVEKVRWRGRWVAYKRLAAGLCRSACPPGPGELRPPVLEYAGELQGAHSEVEAHYVGQGGVCFLQPPLKQPQHVEVHQQHLEARGGDDNELEVNIRV